MTPEKASQGSFRAQLLESLEKPHVKYSSAEEQRQKLILDAKSGKLFIEKK